MCVVGGAICWVKDTQSSMDGSGFHAKSVYQQSDELLGALPLAHSDPDFQIFFHLILLWTVVLFFFFCIKSKNLFSLY